MILITFENNKKKQKQQKETKTIKQQKETKQQNNLIPFEVLERPMKIDYDLFARNK